MRLAALEVIQKLPKEHRDSVVCLVDGNKVPKDMPAPTHAVIKGDGSIFSIAAASILAKVVRDRIMVEYSTKYPQYGFEQHKGYPTAHHRMALLSYGPSSIHRMSYKPVYESALVHNRDSLIVPTKVRNIKTVK